MIYLVASASIFIFSPSPEQDMTSVPRDKCTTNQLNATYFPFLSNYSQHFDILDSPTSFNSFIRQETKIVSRAGYSFKYHSLVAHHRIIYISRITHLRNEYQRWTKHKNVWIFEAAFLIFQPRLRAREIITRDEALYIQQLLSTQR